MAIGSAVQNNLKINLAADYLVTFPTGREIAYAAVQYPPVYYGLVLQCRDSKLVFLPAYLVFYSSFPFPSNTFVPRRASCPYVDAAGALYSIGCCTGHHSVSFLES
ncbi:uncharacterized protein ARMOST_02989 [Armillaria ostoyae]|uniref:Uncharacterized protein n=1 Tax=Armillaria ostoyae TaxID=47428 RepID=A0A284QT63_ARMOS|nr:uncharacterized protein ARMOST_02989 [Armillaria ostoyae]